MRLSDIAAKARDFLPTHRQWKKGNWTGVYYGWDESAGMIPHRMCLGMAILMAAGTEPLQQEDASDCLQAVPLPLLKCTVKIIKEQFPERVTGEADEDTSLLAGQITGFNDHRQTRHADVRAVLEKLAADESLDS